MITGISVHNFKSIRELPDLKLGDMNFIIGKNGVGKTNLLSVLEITRKLAAGERLEEVTSQIAPFSTDFFTRSSNSSSSSVTLQLKGSDGKRYELAYTVALNNVGLIISDEKLSVFDDGSFKEVYVRKGDSFSARVSLSEELSKIPLGVKADELALANYENVYAAQVSSLMSSCKMLWFDRLTDAYTVRLHRSDALDRTNLDGLVVSLYVHKKEQFDKAVSIIQQIIPEFMAPRVTKITPPSAKSQQDSEGSKALDRYIVYWGESNVKDLAYTLSGLSDGNFRVIQLIFALFDCEGSSCVIGEEIENGQHYGRIKTLMEVLKHLSVKLNVQLLFTTHSGEILNQISPSDIIFCTKDEQGYSQYRRLPEIVDTQMVSDELGHEPTAKELIDFGVI